MEPILRKISAAPWPVLVQAATWTLLLMLTVGFASFAPEMAFVSTLSSSSNLCDGGNGLVRIPIDLPGEMVCVPSETVKRSAFDLFVPTIFAGVMVVASVSLIRSCFGMETHI
ncbi:hypothetical protein Bca52824_042459 [Brassica carinata]|uniref:Uncharacterized protein n=1 Tax=Brassica carinata TaxID=52824 RepID=A0A8X7RWS0_BRACI|nr:hypothetical protein Bca52824_042459 [Brassica carinata]